MKHSPIFRAIKVFLTTTTLHGFKYLCSPYYIDRMGWALWCCASACCGGVLCGVVWARFLHTPALLVARDPVSTSQHQPTPLVAVCVSTDRLVHTMANHLSINRTTIPWLPVVLNQIFQGSSSGQDQMKLLDNFLTSHNLTLPKMLVDFAPSCPQLTAKCRWQDVMVDCNYLFAQEIDQQGVCCVMRPNKLKHPRRSFFKRLEINQRLLITLQCNSGSAVFGCEFYTRYQREEGRSIASLEAGFNYIMHLQFMSLQDSDSERLGHSSCEASSLYYRRYCLDKCTEQICGCSDPLRQINTDELDVLPPCLVSQMNCLTKVNNSDCNCPPSCKQIKTGIVIESSPINGINSCIDPLYSELNATTSIVLDIRVKITRSKIYDRMPTETWLTLLSSLGGIFNMFLGVGLFSALEVLFFIIVKLPLALRKSAEITPVTEVYSDDHRIFTARSRLNDNKE